jgi:Na+/alanine symporter
MAIWSILRPLGTFCARLVDFMAIWYILPALVCCNKKNLAALPQTFFS